MQQLKICPQKGPRNKLWITEEIFNKLSDIRKIKNTPQYEILDKEIHKMCRDTKEKWFETK
uniref:Uncharacterized protein n=1 Tax=Arion vulgaris TaxID=1028688 RepID=A0A0B6ZJJ1_9EUPU